MRLENVFKINSDVSIEKYKAPTKKSIRFEEILLKTHVDVPSVNNMSFSMKDVKVEDIDVPNVDKVNLTHERTKSKC